MRHGVWGGLISFLLVLDATAGVYKWVDANGKTHYGDRAPSQQTAQQITLKVNTIDGPPTLERADGSAPGVPANAKIKPEVWIYSAVWCGVCTQAKRYFAARGVPYRELDIDQSAQAKSNFAALGGRGVPLIFVGQTRMNGFSVASMAPILQAAGY